METLVLTVISDDRPGLVATLSASLAARGATWQRSQLSQLAGKFAGIVEVVVPAAGVDGLVADLDGLSAQGITVSTTRTSAASEAPTHHLTLDLVGAEGLDWIELQIAAADTLKRVLAPEVGADAAAATLDRITAFTEVKTVWHTKSMI